MHRRPEVSISIVSHGQAALVADVLADLQQHCATAIEMILTLNISEDLPFRPDDFAFPVRVIRNNKVQGFGANHNAASRIAAGRFFCILNPDIRLPADPFLPLMSLLEDETVGAVSARVLGPQGQTEDHARRFPTAVSILKKVLAGAPTAGGSALETAPDWIAGMFMMLRTDLFRRVGGFDERYFLYYEDVDLCARLRTAGFNIRVDAATTVVHNARRASRRNLRYLLWHLGSLARFLFTRPRTLRPLPTAVVSMADVARFGPKVKPSGRDTS